VNAIRVDGPSPNMRNRLFDYFGDHPTTRRRPGILVRRRANTGGK
jgi:hypothetical protein